MTKGNVTETHFNGVPFIIFDGKRYLTMALLARLTGKGQNSLNQMVCRDRYTVFGPLPTVRIPEIPGILVEEEVLYNYPLFRERGLPTVLEGRAKAMTFDKEGNIVLKWFPANKIDSVKVEQITSRVAS